MDDVEGVLGPPASLSFPLPPNPRNGNLQGFSSLSKPLPSFPVSSRRSSSKFVTSTSSGHRSLPSHPKRRVTQGPHVARIPVTGVPARSEQFYSSPALQRDSSDHTLGIPSRDTNSSDPPPSYSPPRKTSSEDSVRPQPSHRRNSSRRARYRKDKSRSSSVGVETESDQAATTSKGSSVRDFCDPQYPCGCAGTMTHWSSSNGIPNTATSAPEGATWGAPQPSGLPRSYPSSVPFHKLSHTKYPQGGSNLSRRPLMVPSHHCCPHFYPSVPPCSSHPCCNNNNVCTGSNRQPNKTQARAEVTPSTAHAKG